MKAHSAIRCIIRKFPDFNANFINFGWTSLLRAEYILVRVIFPMPMTILKIVARADVN